MWSSGFRSSISGSVLRSPAFTSPAPRASNVAVLGPSLWILNRICFRLSRISGTSSLIPVIVVNSCWTPSILTAVTAAPGSDDRSPLRRAFPSVTPNPRSRGSMLNLPYRFVATLSSTSTFFGICRFFHFILSPTSVRLWLLRVKLHDELLGHLGRDIGARRILQYASGHLLVVDGKPAHHIPPLALLHGRENHDVRLAVRPYADLIADLHLEARHVHDPIVHRDVPVPDEPSGRGARGAESHAEDDVVQSPFELEKQVLAGDALLALRFREIVPELPLQNAVDPPRLLLHAELETVARFLGAAILSVLPGRVAAAFERAFLREAARPFEEEFFSLPAAEPALVIVKRRHVFALNLPLSLYAALRAGAGGPRRAASWAGGNHCGEWA